MGRTCKLHTQPTHGFEPKYILRWGDNRLYVYFKVHLPSAPLLPLYVWMCLVMILWVGAWGLSTNIIGIEYSSLKNISTEPTLYQVPQRATQLRKNRYMENQADIKQKRLNRITRKGGRWEGGLKMDPQNPAARKVTIVVLPYTERL